MEKQVYQEMFDIEETHWWYRGLRDLVFSSIRRVLGEKSEMKILDAGCGTGIVMKSLSDYGTPFGIDISSSAIKFCRERGLNNVAGGSVSALPFQDNSFDLVLSLDVLGHEAVNETQAIEEMYRVLKKGGILLTNAAAHAYLWRNYDERWGWKRRYSKNELRTKLEKSGFETLKISYHLALLFPVLVFFKLINSVCRVQAHNDLKPVFGPLNALLYGLLRIENLLLKRINVPIGTSIFCISKK